MTKILYTKRKTGNSYLVWFQNSNLFFNLEEPAWFVFRKTVKRHKKETIAKEFSERYGLAIGESLKFVGDVRQKIAEMNEPRKYKRYFEIYHDEIINFRYALYSKHYYDLFNKVIEFSFETLWLEKYMHPLLRYLEVKDIIREKSHFELFTYKGIVILRIDGKLKGSWTKDESQFTKGRVFIELANILHDKQESDWLMTVHASAISNGKKTILFSASPGSGKTTFAALLRANGYQIVSDDFVPIEQSTFKAYPLPIAMSVKLGSVDLLKPYFPELETNPVVTVNSIKKVKYLPVDKNMMNLIFPVNEFIFIKYDKKVEFRLEKIDSIEGLKFLLDEAWIPASLENVRNFLNRILQVSFYRLTYSDNKKAIDSINQIFNDEKK